MVSGNRNNPLFVLQERLIGPRFRIGPLSGRSIQSARSRRLDLLDVLRVPRPRLPVLPRAAATEALVVKSRKPYLCLPFRDSSFDAIISRGVLLSYVVDPKAVLARSEEHTSELQSRLHLVCRLLLEKKKTRYCLYMTN